MSLGGPELVAVCHRVIEVSGKVKVNQSQCKALGEKVLMIKQILSDFDAKAKEQDLQHTSNYSHALDNLKRTLNKTSEVLTQFSKKTWFKKVLRVGCYSKHEGPF